MKVKGTWLTLASGTPEELESDLDSWEFSDNVIEEVEVTPEETDCNIYVLAFGEPNITTIDCNYPTDIQLVLHNGRVVKDINGSYSTWIKKYTNNNFK